MKENEFVLISNNILERLNLEIRSIQSFTLIIHSKNSQRIVDNRDKHIKYHQNWCFVLDKSWQSYSKTIDDIHTCVNDFMNGYDYRVKEEKEKKEKEQFLKDEIEAWKIHIKLLKKERKNDRKNS